MSTLTKQTILGVIVGCLILLVGLKVFGIWPTPPQPPVDDCLAAESTTDPRITVTTPQPDQKVSSPLDIAGQARGYWFFEASFPIVLLDCNGQSLASGIATARGEWMTEEFVPFTASLTFTPPAGLKYGVLVFKKDNPSGLPENDAEIRVPVRFE
jgi:hypothetical protein